MATQDSLAKRPQREQQAGARATKRAKQATASAAGPEAPQPGMDAASPSDSEQLFAMRAVGLCRSVFANKRGVPRQGRMAPSSRGVVELYAHMAPETLEGLQAYSHVWLVFVFSRNTNKAKREAWVRQARGKGAVTFPPKVKPPLLGGEPTGLFATRTPHRPNPIGLTLAKLEGVRPAQRQIIVSGIDLCDETPILDIKPYVPSDAPHGAASFPAWVHREDAVAWSVSIGEEARMAIQQLLKDKVPEFYSAEADLLGALEEVLALDVRAVHHGRGSTADTGPTLPTERHQCVVDNIQFFFDLDAAARKAVVRDARRYDKSKLPPIPSGAAALPAASAAQ